jgi:hypothetical protein
LTNENFKVTAACFVLLYFADVQSVASRIIKSKAIPLQALTSPEGSRRLRFLDFKTIST